MTRKDFIALTVANMANIKIGVRSTLKQATELADGLETEGKAPWSDTIIEER